MEWTVQALEQSEHVKGVLLVHDALASAQLALTAGQPEIYKARLQSAYVTLGVLLKKEVV